jgi:hypothetical protein
MNRAAQRGSVPQLMQSGRDNRRRSNQDGNLIVGMVDSIFAWHGKTL